MARHKAWTTAESNGVEEEEEDEEEEDEVLRRGWDNDSSEEVVVVVVDDVVDVEEGEWEVGNSERTICLYSSRALTTL